MHGRMIPPIDYWTIQFKVLIVQLLHPINRKPHKSGSGRAHDPVFEFDSPRRRACKLCTGIHMVEFVLIIFFLQSSVGTERANDLISPAATPAEHHPDTPQ